MEFPLTLSLHQSLQGPHKIHSNSKTMPVIECNRRNFVRDLVLHIVEAFSLALKKRWRTKVCERCTEFTHVQTFLTITVQWISCFVFFFTQNFEQPPTKKPMVKKVWKKYEKSCDGLPSSPKIKTRWQSLRDPTNIFYPHFLRTLGGGGHFHVTYAQLPMVGTGELRWVASARCQLDQLLSSRSIDFTLSPRLSARLTQCDDHLLRDHVRERCGQGERRQWLHITHSGPVPGWPPR